MGLGSAGLTCGDFPVSRGGLRQGIMVTRTQSLYTHRKVQEEELPVVPQPGCSALQPAFH